MHAFLTSLFIVAVAEMGDKTQLLAMAFATRYPWRTVMAGVLAATAVNHLLAVLAGTWLTAFVPLGAVRLAAALSFILFGLWTLRGDRLEGEDTRLVRGPFWTVAIAFFMAEMADKTQLATLALAADFNAVVPVWLGTTSGMMVADGFGIAVGVVMGKRIPERAVKLVAAGIFMVFGLVGVWREWPAFRTLPVMAGALVVLALLIRFALRAGVSSAASPQA